MKTVEQMICPKEGVLIVNGEEITSRILDAEMDVLDLSFDNDGCVNIDTDHLEYIKLSYENLECLIDLLIRTEDKYEEILK